MRRPVALLLAIVAAVGASDELERGTVDVADLPIEPLARLRWFDERLEFHPKALVGSGWNSNIFADDRNISAFYLRALIGAEVRWFGSPVSRLDLGGELDDQQYLQQSQGDLLGGRGYLVYRREGLRTLVTGRTDYERRDTPQEQTGEQIIFDHLRGDGEWDRRGLTWHAVGGLTIDRIIYQQDSRLFDAGDRDAWRWLGRARIGRAYAPDSEWFVSALVGQTYYDRDDRFQDGTRLRVQLGVDHRLLTRTQAFVQVGVEGRQFADDFRHDPAYDDRRILVPVGAAGLRWEPEPLSGAQIRAISDVYDSLTANAAWYWGIEADGRLRLRERFFAFSADYLHIAQDSGAPAGTAAEQRTTVELAGGLGYALRDGVVIRTRVAWTDSNSDIGLDYRRVLIAADLGVAF